MAYRSRKKRVGSQWKVVRRCVVFFTTVCVIPVLLVLLVATDQYLRPPSALRSARIAFPRPESNSLDLVESKSVPKNMSTVALRMERRRTHMRRMCRHLSLDRAGNDSLHRPNAWEFLVDRKHKLVWCNVFKAASTSWMYNFNLLAGYSPQFLKKSKLVPLNLARQRYPRPSLAQLQRALNDSISFLIARHPLERLLSAYRDKLQYSLPHTHHRKLGNEIIIKYRRNKTERENNQRWPTFPEFVEYLLDSVKQGQTLDMHWTPIAEFCTPCLFHFDVIAHTETLQEDQEYLIRKANLQNVIKPEWKNPGRGTTADQIAKYYSQLTRAQILHLYHIYRYDFELFNYSIGGYLEVGQQDSDPSALLEAINVKLFPPNRAAKSV